MNFHFDWIGVHREFFYVGGGDSCFLAKIFVSVQEGLGPGIMGRGVELIETFTRCGKTREMQFRDERENPESLIVSMIVFHPPLSNSATHISYRGLAFSGFFLTLISDPRSPTP